MFKDLIIGWKSLGWRSSKQTHLFTFWTSRTFLNFIMSTSTGMKMYIRACTFSEVSRLWNSQIYGKLSVCRLSTKEVGAIFNLNMYLWISVIHCLLFKYSCLFWLGVRQIRRISGWPTWTWTVSSMRKIHRNIEDKSWFLLENKKQMPGFATCFLN